MATTGERLHLLYEINRRLATLQRLEDLTRFATQQARDLFGAGGCALLLHDVTRHELYFPVASEDRAHSDAGRRLEQVRFPADRGVAGWVLTHGQGVVVADVAADPRFYQGVDEATGMRTRSIMAAPLRAPSGNIGVIEVVNPDPGSMTADDLTFLQALADDMAVAFEKAALHERLHGEVIGVRQVCRVGGLTLLAVGVLAILGTVARHLALALPLREVPMAAGAVGGAGALLGGVVLLAIARGWLRARGSAQP